ncbi:MAG: hypothetical protein AABY49_11910 [Planctomycetota bacterium]
MLKSNNIGLIRYEFIAYVHVLDTQNVSNILITKDDLANMKSQSYQIDWVPVENMDIDIIENGGIDINSIVKTSKRICGLFDAEPLDWEYARIIVSDSAKTKHSYAIARMPKSPTVPVFFDVKE